MHNSMLDFTQNARYSLANTVSNLSFYTSGDASLIYKQLERNLHTVPFSDFLKRYIFLKSGMTGEYDSVPLTEYMNILKLSFQEHHTPISFQPVTTRKSVMFKNWLTQQSVHRDVVLLLGFGLQMNTEDVNLFLVNALQEAEINFRNPVEILCWYCYQKRYEYPRFAYLAEQLGHGHTTDSYPASDLVTGKIRDTVLHIRDDSELLSFLSKMYTDGNVSKFHWTAKTWFDALYNESCRYIADLYTRTEMERAENTAERYRENVSDNPRIYNYEKEKRVQQKKEQHRTYHPEDITGSDIEQILYSAIPRDKYGNLPPSKKSALHDQFQGKRLLRQNIHEILTDQREVDRYDLLTLLFFVHYSKMSEEIPPRDRLKNFINSANTMLQQCSMGSLYIANPYECFLLMCILSDEPLATFGDIWEMSYQEYVEGRE